MTLDAEKIIEFPDFETWAELYAKLKDPLVKRLNSSYSLADREDAVEEAFHKLMHKKDREAYGEKMPRTEAEWFGALRWQARSYLSHLRDRGDRHAKYIEEMSGLLSGVFADGHQGAGLDAGTRTRALARALDKLRRDQDISRRDLIIYIRLAVRGISGKKLAARFDTNANNVYMIKFRVGNIICKYGPRYFEEALRREGFDPGLDLAA